MAIPRFPLSFRASDPPGPQDRYVEVPSDAQPANQHAVTDGLGGYTLQAIPTAGAGLAAPAFVLGTANVAGVSGSAPPVDSTIAAFDVTVPVTQAFGDAAATGAAAVAARRDHRHGMPANPGSLITTGSHQLTGDVPIPAATPTDVDSLALAAGTWIIMAAYTAFSGGNANCTLNVFDGTSVVATSEAAIAAGFTQPITLISPPIVLAAPATVKITGNSVANTSTIKATSPNNGTANKAGTMVAIKVA